MLAECTLGSAAESSVTAFPLSTTWRGGQGVRSERGTGGEDVQRGTGGEDVTSVTVTYFVSRAL